MVGTAPATTPLPLTRQSIETAHAIIAPKIKRTPLLSAPSLTTSSGNTVLFKPENLQKTGSFKLRGATYSISTLTPEELERGVCTHSSGNHGGAVAFAAKHAGAKATIVMPEGAAAPKVANCHEAGASVIFCEPTAEARASTVARVAEETGAVFIPPYDFENTIIGQGTVFLEAEKQSVEDGWGKLGAIIVPVGGGGLLSGVALAAAGTGVRVFAAEPAGADDCARGIAAGERVASLVPNTIADGVRSPIGLLNFPIIQQHVESILVVPDDEIIESMRLIFDQLKVVAEPTGALAFAAARSEAFKKLNVEGPVAVLISGGNVDLSKPLPWLK